jgi:hypothetical protein
MAFVPVKRDVVKAYGRAMPAVRAEVRKRVGGEVRTYALGGHYISYGIPAHLAKARVLRAMANTLSNI